jgi:hypothetical protein
MDSGEEYAKRLDELEAKIIALLLRHDRDLRLPAMESAISQIFHANVQDGPEWLSEAQVCAIHMGETLARCGLFHHSMRNVNVSIVVRPQEEEPAVLIGAGEADSKLPRPS